MEKTITLCESCLVGGIETPATGHCKNPDFAGYELCEECAAEYDSRECGVITASQFSDIFGVECPPGETDEERRSRQATDRARHEINRQLDATRRDEDMANAADWQAGRITEQEYYRRQRALYAWYDSCIS